MEKITKDHPLSGSQDILMDNIQKLKEIFPEVFSEGRVDFEKLQLLLGDLITPKDDLYGLNWWGKSEVIKESMKRSLGSLRPDKESSKNWDTTQNLYIEGDNLEVLKLLQKSYNGKIKMIYIDPPYNTGKDFVYKDNYKDNLKNYLEQTGQVDSEGIKQSTNTKEDGRYHSNWLNMMYPRLKLARNLLVENGVIFVSIGLEEVANLKKVMDEIFGENNFIEIFSWVKTSTPPALSTKSRKTNEYVVCYEKRKSSIKYNGEKLDGGDQPLLNSGNNIVELVFPKERVFFNTSVFKNGKYPAFTSERVELLDDIFISDGYSLSDFRLKGEFKWTQDFLNEEIEKGTRFIIKSDLLSVRFIREEDGYKRPTNFIKSKYYSPTIDKKRNSVETNENASSQLSDLMGNDMFSYPKPESLIRYFINFICNEGDIILDFFSGSGTTAHSSFNSVIENNKKLSFILVQLPEDLEENLKVVDSTSKKVIENAIEFLKEQEKPCLLSELALERLRRAGDKILKEKKEELDELKSKTSLIQTDEEKAKIQELEEIIAKLDIGFKVFKLDSSNIEAWDTEMPETVKDLQTRIEESRNHLKKGRTEEDLLYELLLKQGLLLTSPIEERSIAGAKVYNINHGELFICMNAPITMEVVEGIGAWGKESIAEAIVDLKPVLVLKDQAFGKDDAFKTNAELRLKNEFGFAKVNTL
jgi:adenine-specific DNA-methyltransferase